MQINTTVQSKVGEGVTTREIERKDVSATVQPSEVKVRPVDDSLGKFKDEKKVTDDVMKSMNEFLKPTQTSLRYKFHEETNEYYVEVVNDVKNEVVREIPSKKLLDMYASMTEFIGILFDKKA